MAAVVERRARDRVAMRARAADVMVLEMKDVRS